MPRAFPNPSHGRCRPCRAHTADPVRGRRGRSRRRPRPDEPESAARGGPGPRWVRMASGTTGLRQALAVTSGMQDPTSLGIQGKDLEERSGDTAGSSHPNSCRRPAALPNEAKWSPWMGLALHASYAVADRSEPRSSSPAGPLARANDLSTGLDRTPRSWRSPRST
jgi:hypothetical protein